MRYLRGCPHYCQYFCARWAMGAWLDPAMPADCCEEPEVGGAGALVGKLL